jgi:predicted DNA-binding transcriptional regulator YafY
MFSPGRIRKLKDTGVTFEPPADFRASAYLDAGFRKVRGAGPGQTVRLRFSPVAARWVREKTWHATQTLQDHPDGGLTLTFSVNHLAEVKRWALSFGADCQVLEPEELREEIKAEARKLLIKD